MLHVCTAGGRRGELPTDFSHGASPFPQVSFLRLSSHPDGRKYMALWSKKGKTEETLPPKASNGSSSGTGQAAAKPTAAPAAKQEAAPNPGAMRPPAVAAAPSQPRSADIQQGEAA